ncbi:MAG TPA: AAA family ATPase [Anaerolineae bacterium]|nr:AAA family ATPase [Anaerolineae bacterium]
MNIPGYNQPTNIYQSKNSIVYRALDDKNNNTVILKTSHNDLPSPQQLAYYQQEFDLLTNLDLAHIIKPLAILPHGRKLLLVIEDFGGTALNTLYPHPLPLPQLLNIAHQTALGLAAIHQQNIIHKDINPANLVYNPDTDQLKIIDFGIATQLSRENNTGQNIHSLEGTFPYMSPEQTGRMNRTLDYRTDLYSLGITLYKLWTNTLPFNQQDTLELVHAHIALSPPPPIQQLDTNNWSDSEQSIARALNEIIMKLLAKNAEDRYQSANGLAWDLDQCQQQLRANTPLIDFTIATHDFSTHFRLPQKLYGRDDQIQSLLHTFNQVTSSANSQPQAIFVAGYAGIGKSALIKELYKPLTQQKGYFIAGKFDQFQRNIPYSALAQALNELCQQLLLEDEAVLAEWREVIQTAVGANGSIITTIVPELGRIIGPQEPLPQLGPTETQNRFNIVFQHFLQVLCTPQHPLVLFLDDLQWADNATLELIKTLLTSQTISHFLLLGAYRDNEITPAHPLRLTTSSLEESGVKITTIPLPPLTTPNITQLLQDTLPSSQNHTPLAELITKKTGGNPFFVSQFLQTLYQDGHLTLQTKTTPPSWHWNLTEIEALDITDNVIDLMLTKLQKLPSETQHLLQLAACLGNKFTLENLATIAQRSLHQTHIDLWPAAQQELLHPLAAARSHHENGNIVRLIPLYKFSHDRIQQTAYTLADEQKRQQTHAHIGQLLLEEQPDAINDNRLFDLVNHLNLGRPHLTSPTQKQQLINLNLQAGHRAQQATAYQPAFNYFHNSINLFPADQWDQDPALARQAHLGQLKTAFLSRQFDQVDTIAATILDHTTIPLERVPIFNIKIQAYLAQLLLPQAITTAIDILGDLGLTLPPEPTQADVMQELQENGAIMATKDPATLPQLPEMDDPQTEAILNILLNVAPAAFRTNPQLVMIIVLKIVNLSLTHGLAKGTLYGFTMYGLLLCGFLNKLDAGFRFGQLALYFLANGRDTAHTARILVIYYNFIHHWQKSFHESLPKFVEAYQVGLELGDFEYAALGAYAYCYNSYFLGHNLDKLEAETASYIESIAAIKENLPLQRTKMYQQALRNLMGHNPNNPRILKGDVYDKDKLMPFHLEVKDFGAVCQLHFNEMMLDYLFGDYASAAANGALAEKYLRSVAGSFVAPVLYFYDTLAWLAQYPHLTPEEQEPALERITANQEKMRAWSDSAPMNHHHRWLLIEAERLAIITNDPQAARPLYDQASQVAQENNFINDEALILERTGRFYLTQNNTRFARTCLQEAVYLYQLWGARAKTDHLKAEFPQFFTQTTTDPTTHHTHITNTSTSTHSTDTLDLNTILKTNQAIAEEIVLDKLLTMVMDIVIENAGAEYGVLILPDGDQWLLSAISQINATTPDWQPIPLGQSQHIAKTVANYVIRTQETIVLHDATQEHKFANDPYIQQNQPKSILCFPLINRGQLSGIIYLENNLTTNAFTPDRLQILNTITTQAAISIDNARLYTQQVELTNAYSRFVPRQILNFLDKDSIIDVQLGDQTEREMTVLFADIRGFTTLSEQMTPKENFDFINTLLNAVGPIIRQHNGFIDKYIGDAIMGLFPYQPDDAVQAAIDIQKQLNIYNQHQDQPVRIGIGIHTGHIMLGVIGETERLEGTVIADAVNTTFRIEGLTKRYGVTTLVSATTLSKLQDPNQYHHRFMDKVRVKGKQQSIHVHELFTADAQQEAKTNTKALFEEATTAYYQRDFTTAITLFNQLLIDLPDDKMTQLYLQQAQTFQETPPPDDWNGITNIIDLY